VHVKITTVKLPISYLRLIDMLVEMGLYNSRGDFIRTAVRDLLEKELDRLHRISTISTCIKRVSTTIAKLEVLSIREEELKEVEVMLEEARSR
jgi:Predicted transcriptional regulators containing the CopG/Arc/MetJ DNA-binding domain